MANETDRLNQAIDILTRTKAFLTSAGEDHWAVKVASVIVELRKSAQEEREELYRYMRREFLGTMGSLQDLAFLKKTTGPFVVDQDLQSTFDELMNELHEALAPEF